MGDLGDFIGMAASFVGGIGGVGDIGCSCNIGGIGSRLQELCKGIAS